MSNAILHISDLHFVLNKKERISKTRFNKNFQDRFIQSLQGIESCSLKYLIVTGDIADTSSEKEYITALSFLNQLVNDLKINKKNVILCPGNHDVSWTELTRVGETEDIEDSELYRRQTEKFARFTKFYLDFFDDKKPSFNVNNAVFDTIIDDVDKIVIVAINTCFRESNQAKDHIGYINQTSFEDELAKIDFQKQYKDYGKLLAMHHNPKDLSAEKHHNLENWKDLNKSVIGYPFIVICGHIHGADGEATIKDDENTIFYISTGSLTKNNIDNTFNIYTNLQNESLDALYYALEDKESPEKYYWQHLTGKIAVKKPKFRPSKEIPLNKPDELNILLENILESDKQDLTRKLNKPEAQQTTPASIVLDKSIMHFIKERNLFKSGHFHWKNEFRSHGFIDINNLVSHKDSLEVITRLFYNQLTNMFNNCFEDTIIIAVGIECNIIGARLSALLDCKYSFIPEPTKKDDFSEIEKTINSENYVRIVLLKDIVFTAEHSKELLTTINIENKEVYVFSLFYCGNRIMKEKIFADHTNVFFMSICDDIEINQCDYCGKGRLEKCSIYMNKLEEIYEDC